jgi:hypothetical protein
MDTHHDERRAFLRRMASLGVAGIIAGLRPALAHSGQASGESRMKVTYDPAATFELKVSEVEFEGSEHEWVAQPGPQTDRAREMVKAFIARQVKA